MSAKLVVLPYWFKVGFCFNILGILATQNIKDNFMQTDSENGKTVSPLQNTWLGHNYILKV